MWWRMCLCLSALLAGCAGSPTDDFGNRPGSGGKSDSGPDASPFQDGDVPTDVPSCTVTPAPSQWDVVVDVSHAGPYGSHTFTVPAATDWVNTGAYLRTGETATVTANSGTWSLNGMQSYGAAGATPVTVERGCAVGSLTARVGLTYGGAITCVATGSATITATVDGPLFVGMIAGTDLGDAYDVRSAATGALNVTIASTANTVPVVTRDEFACTNFDDVASGTVELAGKHVSLILPVAAVKRDRATAVASIDTLDAIYESHQTLRGDVPFLGQRIRFVNDESVSGFAYMLAGNPIRMVNELVGGADTHRVLRVSDPSADIWGVTHELGHTFTMIRNVWAYMYGNLEPWANVFTLYTLPIIGRTANQPNFMTYCDGKNAYLASTNYDTFRPNNELQLCFLSQFTAKYGNTFWKTFFAGINTTKPEDIPYNGTDASIWGFVRARFNTAAGEDTTPIFNTWGVPLP